MFFVIAVMKNLLPLLFIILSICVRAQDVAGYWYGTANADYNGEANNYLVELILKQNGKKVDGVINYYFKNTFRSFKTTGTYNDNNRYLSLYNIPLTYFASKMRMEVDCPTDLGGKIRVAKASSNLNGSFKSKGIYKQTCPQVYFDLKLSKDSNTDSILTALRQFKEKYQLWTPSGSDTTIAATILQRPVKNYVVTRNFQEREKLIAEELTVNGDSLKIDFYDNGVVDGDSISIFFNDKLLASSQKLSSKSIHLNIALDTSKEINEITMFADNLGSIPPNTALMVVYDGKTRYDIRISSTLEQNGTLRIRRKFFKK